MTHEIPSVSVVTPLYNKEREVARAVRSVLAQTFQDFEIVVVNDGSTDRGPDVVRGIADGRIRLLHQANAGVSAARNRGIEEARADLIAFLDADDEWMPTFLATILRLRDNYPQCAVFATGYTFRYQNGRVRKPIFRGIPPEPWEGVLSDYFAVAARSDPPLCSSAVASVGDAIRAVGGFPEGITSGEDLLTWAKLALRHDMAYSSEPQAVFWVRTRLGGLPTRVPSTQDIVGQTLGSLLLSVPPGKRDGFQQYVALWHRMRAVMFLQLGNRSEALNELDIAERYSGRTTLLRLYRMAASSGRFVSKCVMNTRNVLRSLRRAMREF